MKTLRFFPILWLGMALPLQLFSQEMPSDSIPAYDLDEVKVEAPKVIRKGDMDIYHPSETAVGLSSNGLQLLTRLMIPAVAVDELMGSVKAAGENVQLRINGREASIDQIRNLSPQDVKRVEWMDNPGLRYNGASYVLNFIVANPTAGGSLSLNFQPIFNVLFGNYSGDIKINNGRSQWGLGFYFKPTDSDKIHREYRETFTYPDGKTVTRIETPLGGRIKNTQGSANLSYSYIKPDTTIFYAYLSDWGHLSNLARFRGRLQISGENEDLNLLNESGDKGHTPKLSLYLEQHFPKRQTLVVDFSASVFSGHSFSEYLESYPETDFYINDIHTYIKDLNQAYGLEADYMKEFGNSKLTAGLNYAANRNRSRYLNLDNAVFHQRQDKLYFFGEYYLKVNKFSVIAGMGAQYTSFIFKETDQWSRSWNLRPQATLTYSPFSSSQFRLNFTAWQTTPSLSETNIAPQQTDGFQWNIGNPHLKTATTYRLNFRYGFNFPRISGNFNISASSTPHAISPYLFWENDKLITSYENSKGKQALTFSLSPQLEAIPRWLTVSGSFSYLAERAQGTGYKLYNHNWCGDIIMLLSHWNFSLMVQYSKAQRSLWGEKISWGEDISIILLYYQWKNWQFGAVSFMPFGKYDQGSKTLSKWNNNEYHLRIDFQMVGLYLNYNLQWGRQKKGVSKLVESDASVDKSSAKSR